MECFLSMLKTFRESDSKWFELWASSIFYMNDSRELYHGYDMLMNSILPDIEEKMSLPPELRVSRIWSGTDGRRKEADYKKSFIDSLMKNNGTPFVVSFSRKKDDSTMWDRYGDKGRGVCLVFSEYDYEFVPAELPKNSDVEKVTAMQVDDVCYDGCLDECCRKVLVSTYRKLCGEAGNSADAKKLFGLKLKYLSSFVAVLAAFIKIKDFASEDETRFIEFVSDDECVLFRCAKDGTLIPFIKKQVPICDFRGVYVGPASRVELNKKALESMFHNNKALADKFVRTSNLSPDLFR